MLPVSLILVCSCPCPWAMLPVSLILVCSCVSSWARAAARAASFCASSAVFSARAASLCASSAVCSAMHAVCSARAASFCASSAVCSAKLRPSLQPAVRMHSADPAPLRSELVVPHCHHLLYVLRSRQVCSACASPLYQTRVCSDQSGLWVGTQWLRAGRGMPVHQLAPTCALCHPNLHPAASL